MGKVINMKSTQNQDITQKILDMKRPSLQNPISGNTELMEAKEIKVVSLEKRVSEDSLKKMIRGITDLFKK